MQTFTATEAKTNFGLIIDTAQREVVTIEKKGRPYAVVISAEEYKAIEDFYWAASAKEAEEGGYLSVEQSENLLSELRKNAKDKT